MTEMTEMTTPERTTMNHVPTESTVLPTESTALTGIISNSSVNVEEMIKEYQENEFVDEGGCDFCNCICCPCTLCGSCVASMWNRVFGCCKVKPKSCRYMWLLVLLLFIY